MIWVAGGLCILILINQYFWGKVKNRNIYKDNCITICNTHDYHINMRDEIMEDTKMKIDINENNIQKKPKKEKSTIISIRIPISLSKLMAQKNISPSRLFLEAAKAIGYKKQ